MHSIAVIFKAGLINMGQMSRCNVTDLVCSYNPTDDYHQTEHFIIFSLVCFGFYSTTLVFWFTGVHSRRSHQHVLQRPAIFQQKKHL